MLSSVLRGQSSSTDATAILSRAGLHANTTWSPGSARSNKHVSEKYGFNVGVSTSHDWSVHSNELAAFLTRYQSALTELRSMRFTLDIDIGVSVGESDSLARSLPVGEALLQALLQNHVGLIFSVYVVGDDESAPHETQNA
jgi:hypothetical protein